MGIMATLYALAADVDAREDFTRYHSEKVCEYATDIARTLCYSREDIDRIRMSALLHDIGKIGLVTSDKLLAEYSLLPTPTMQSRPHARIALPVLLENSLSTSEKPPAAISTHELPVPF